MAWKANLQTALYVVVGLGNLVPGLLFLSPQPSSLEKAYGVSLSASKDLLLMLRHRAVLLGTVGASLLYSAARRNARNFVTPIAAVSMASYVGLYLTIPGLNAQSAKVARADLVLIGLLGAAQVL